MNLPSGDITYHLEGRFWEMAKIQALEFAPKWDGHTARDVLKRLESWQPDI
jgi:hypothetical protein